MQAFFKKCKKKREFIEKSSLITFFYSQKYSRTSFGWSRSFIQDSAIR